MSYLDFFKLNEDPFSNTPVVNFYFESTQHTQALRRLMHAAERMKGLALCVGQIGYGKTTLARRLLEKLPEDQYEAALLVIIHSGISANWLLKRIAMQLGVENPANEKLILLSQLYKRLLQIREEGRRAVVLIDEAQMLQTREIMEEFRGLLNLEIPGHKLLSFIFFGLPEIDRNLRIDPPLLQRVAMRYELKPFDYQSTVKYIVHRLSLSGNQQEIFNEDALRMIHASSGGVPRVINTICDNALFEGFVSEQRQIGIDIISEIVAELGLIEKDEHEVFDDIVVPEAYRESIDSLSKDLSAMSEQAANSAKEENLSSEQNAANEESFERGKEAEDEDIDKILNSIDEGP